MVIIDAGYVSSSITYVLVFRDMTREIGDRIVLMDINVDKIDWEVKNICHGLPATGTADLYAEDYSDGAACGLIIVTAVSPAGVQKRIRKRWIPKEYKGFLTLLRM